MDHPAALHRLKVGVPATVEHSSEAGPETGKWVAETTQVSIDKNVTPCFLTSRLIAEFYYVYGRTQATSTRQGSAPSYFTGTGDRICAV